MAALRAALRGGKEPVNFDQLPPIPCALVREHGSEHAEAGVRQAASQAVIANHAAHVQVLDIESSEAAHEVRRHLVQVVGPRVGDAFLQARHAQALALPATASLGSAAEASAGMLELPQPKTEMAGVRNALSVRERRQPVDAEVDSRLFLAKRQSLRRLVEHESREVATGGRLGYRHRRGLACELTAPANIERAELRQRNGSGAAAPAKGAARVFGALLAALLFERRVGRALLAVRFTPTGGLRVQRVG